MTVIVTTNNLQYTKKNSIRPSCTYMYHNQHFSSNNLKISICSCLCLFTDRCECTINWLHVKGMNIYDGPWFFPNQITISE